MPSGAVSFFPSSQAPQGRRVAVPHHPAPDELFLLLRRVSRASGVLGTIRKDVSQVGMRELEGILGWEGEGIEFLEEPRLPLDPWNCPRPGWSSLEGGRCPCAWQGVALDDPEALPAPTHCQLVLDHAGRGGDGAGCVVLHHLGELSQVPLHEFQSLCGLQGDNRWIVQAFASPTKPGSLPARYKNPSVRV